jgi:hypothetical protein
VVDKEFGKVDGESKFHILSYLRNNRQKMIEVAFVCAFHVAPEA